MQRPYREQDAPTTVSPNKIITIHYHDDAPAPIIAYLFSLLFTGKKNI
ncbi:MAG: hypothetical protein AB4080_12260 [Trichodesmium sp.]